MYDGGSPRLCPAWLCNVGNFCSFCLCPSSQREWKGKERRDERGHTGEGSERGDIVECVVQLLADGLILHLLCIDFIWGVVVQGWVGVWGEGIEGKKTGRREGNGKGEQESEADRDGVKETGQRTGRTAVRAPSSPLCTTVSFILLCTLN